MKKSETK